MRKLPNLLLLLFETGARKFRNQIAKAGQRLFKQLTKIFKLAINCVQQRVVHLLVPLTGDGQLLLLYRPIAQHFAHQILLFRVHGHHQLIAKLQNAVNAFRLGDCGHLAEKEQIHLVLECLINFCRPIVQLHESGIQLHLWWTWRRGWQRERMRKMATK